MSQSANPSKTTPPRTRLRARRPRSCASPRRRQFLPRLDLMEDRTLLSNLTVINNNDSGSGSLRAAIAAAHSGDTINFANSLIGQTIKLTSGELAIAKSLTVDGLGASQLTVSGGASRVFDIASGAHVTLSGLTIANGVAVQGAGIDNFGTVTVDRCTLLNNKAIGGSGDSTTPDAANGGGIANEIGASLSLTRSLLLNNAAVAHTGIDSFGGGLLNLGSATIVSCTFTANQASGGDSSSDADGSQGGAISSWLSGSVLMVSNSTFSGNQALGGTGPDFGVAGAIDVEVGSVATINNSNFAGNVASGGTGCIAQGGALFANGCTLTLSDTSFTGNQALGGTAVGSISNFPSGEAEAGAILVFIGATVNIGNSSFTGNVAQGGTGSAGGFGGAIVNTGGTVTLTSTTLNANKAIGGTGTGGSHSTRTWLEVAASTTSLEVLSRLSTAC